MKKVTKRKIFQFRAKLAVGLWRDFEIDGSDTLEELATAILAAYQFDCDHCYGFYSKIKGNKSESEEVYELFADLEDGSYIKHAKGVYETIIDDVFSPKKQMLFFFDYGDSWEFILTCKDIVQPEEGVRYPRTTGSKGDAPKQYPPIPE